MRCLQQRFPNRATWIVVPFPTWGTPIPVRASPVRPSWKLNAGEIALLAGFSERSWARAKAGSWPGTLSQDQMTRASTLIGIFKGLKLLFSDPLANEWVRLPNRNRLFGGRTPIEAMIAGGIPLLLEVRRHVDALRGGL